MTDKGLHAGALRNAQVIALATPAVLLSGAYISQLVFGLYPCEMCWWQRYPHFAALGLAVLAWVAPVSTVSGVLARRLFVFLAAAAILVSGALGVFHAGVEYGWWEGVTNCALAPAAGDDPLASVLNAPLTRCDQAPWSLFGISLAGWNALISGAAGLAIMGLLAHKGGHEQV